MGSLALAPVLPGETLGGKYRVERLLGQGGMGIVVAARHIDLDERVAIKFLLGEPSERATDRFLREARAAAKVKGEHVCRVFDFGRLDTGEPYIVMEYLEGTDLGSKLSREGPQPALQVVRWVIEVCAALSEAHAHGIVHRDVKPANILLATRPDGSTCAKVLDFGISKLPKAETLTSPEQMMGSPMYMSPEQMQSARDVDLRSDVWSLGVTMYKLLTGEPPFDGESMVELALRVREKEPRAIESLQPNVPEELRRVIERCLAKKREDRYANVAELVADLVPIVPADVTPLATRITSPRETAASVELEATVSARSAPSPKSETFPPLQTTLGSETRTSLARAWPLVGAAVAVAIAVGLSRSSSPAPAVAAAASLASAQPPLPQASVSSVPVAAPSVVVDAGPPMHVPLPRRTAPAKPLPSAAPTSVAPTSVAAPSASAAVTIEPRVQRKREIDRDDP